MITLNGEWKTISTNGLSGLPHTAIDAELGERFQFVYKDIDIALLPLNITKSAVLAAIDAKQILLPGRVAIMDKYITNERAGSWGTGKFDLVVETMVIGKPNPIPIAVIAAAIVAGGTLYLMTDFLKEIKKFTEFGVEVGDTKIKFSMGAVFGFSALALGAWYFFKHYLGRA